MLAADSPRPLSVVVPCYNEASTVGALLRRVAEVPVVREIVVVDDASSDGSREILRSLLASWPASAPPLRVFLQPANRGKGAALREGFRHVEGPISVVQDADLEYDPRELPRLIQPILDGDADVVYGSRFEGFPRRVLFFWHSLGNRFLTMLSNMTTNLNLTDMETCYKAFRSEIIRSLPLRCERFGFEPEVTAKLAKLGCRIYEVPVSYRGRSYAEGKKIGWWDGVKALAVILRFWLSDDLGLDTGTMTLRVMRKADRYNRWIYETVRPWLGRDLLEIGSGIGNMTRHFLRHGQVTASDVSPRYVEELRRTFSGTPNVEVRDLDISKDSYPRTEIHDTIVCLNVLEHIEDDVAALRNMRKLLRPGGRAVIFVPANPRLYCEIDRGVGHYRRYVKEELARRMAVAGFRLLHARYHNPVGAVGWWVSGRALGRKTLTSGGVRGFDALMPLLRLQDRVDTRFSLSVLAVGERV
jgi:glycosyltransferase involved in cell wall biosynthesis